MIKKIYLQGAYKKLAKEHFPFYALHIDKNPERPPTAVHKEGDEFFVMIDESWEPRLMRGMLPLTVQGPAAEAQPKKRSSQKQPATA